MPQPSHCTPLCTAGAVVPVALGVAADGAWGVCSAAGLPTGAGEAGVEAVSAPPALLPSTVRSRSPRAAAPPEAAPGACVKACAAMGRKVAAILCAA
jgi:hypothetical protein